MGTFPNMHMLDIKNFREIPCMTFPTGRKTHVMIGQNGAIKGSGFCQGFVEIEPGGSIPSHNHETVESYTIIEGEGVITVDRESQTMKQGDYIFINSWQEHGFVNNGNKTLLMMFCYSPQVVVDHWAKEMASKQV